MAPGHYARGRCKRLALALALNATVPLAQSYDRSIDSQMAGRSTCQLTRRPRLRQASSATQLGTAPLSDAE
jgi:hypothetical protein